MKTFIITLIIAVLQLNISAQSVCDPLLNSSTPPSPFTHGYLKFDGRGDFLRTNDINALEFPAETTNDFEAHQAESAEMGQRPKYCPTDKTWNTQHGIGHVCILPPHAVEVHPGQLQAPDCQMVPKTRPRPAMAADPRPVSDPGFGIHASADPGQPGRGILRPLSGAIS